MGLKENIEAFEYERALLDLNIRNRDHLWVKLQKAARERRDPEEAQMIHDLSWYLTQISQEERDQLKSIASALKERLTREFGQHSLTMLAERGITINTFVAPLGKKRKDAYDDPFSTFKNESMEPYSSRATVLPSSEFSSKYASAWTFEVIIKNIHVEKIPRVNNGERIKLYIADCDRCNGTRILKDRFDRCIDRLRCTHCDGSGIDNDRIDHIVNDPDEIGNHPQLLRIAMQNNGRISMDDLSRILGSEVECYHCSGTGWTGDFIPSERMSFDEITAHFGEEVLCPECLLYVEVPEGVKDNWLCPLVDVNGNRKDWCRAEVV